MHIGDVHLDTTFYSKDNEIREKLRQSLRESFSAVIDDCIKEDVNALLIAGDLFDNHQLSFQTEQLLINGFTKLKENGINVYYATGNHDPGDEKFRVNSIQWPDNVTVFSNDKVCKLEVLDKNQQMVAKIVSVGHENSKEARNLLKNFPNKEDTVPHVGLVHAMVTNATGVDKHDRYLPCTKEDLEEKGYDYWALGHIHQYQKISENNSIYYCGNLQGRHPRESGEKGGLLVTIAPLLMPIVEFKSFSKVIWKTLSIDKLETIQTYSQLVSHLIDRISTHFKTKTPKIETILRIELKGGSHLKEELQSDENIVHIETDIKHHFNLLAVEVKTDELTTVHNVEEYKEGQHVLAKTLELLQKLNENHPLMDKLLEIPFANKQVKTTSDKINYIKKLSANLQVEAVNRMVGEKK